MKLRQRKIGVLLIAVILVAVAVAVSLGVKQAADSRSRTQARAAAQTYVKAAHSYLQSAASDFNTEGAPTTTNDQAYAATKALEKLQKTRPKLLTVKGAGAKLAVYKAAVAYRAKVEVFAKAADANTKAGEIFQPFANAYASLDSAQNDISNGKLTSGDPASAVTDTIVKPLTAAKAAFQKATVPAAYAVFAKDLNATFDDYIGAGNTLVSMYQTGNLHSADFNFYPQLLAVYNDLDAAAAPINAQALSLSAQAQALAKQP